MPTKPWRTRVPHLRCIAFCENAHDAGVQVCEVDAQRFESDVDRLDALAQRDCRRAQVLVLIVGPEETPHQPINLG